MHPLAFPDNRGGFTDGNGRKVIAGNRVEYRFENHRRGILDEALHDGDAFVTWDDGSYATVKWRDLAKIFTGIQMMLITIEVCDDGEGGADITAKFNPTLRARCYRLSITSR